ncbi:MAG: hypothetical protein M3O46_18070, partial [Myxococcota bacterium]|nr:hypothetical protein [Myxococcota bacterium]
MASLVLGGFHTMRKYSMRRSLLVPLPWLTAVLALGACGGGSGKTSGSPPPGGTVPVTGQTDFESAPPYGSGGVGGVAPAAGSAGSGGANTTAASPAPAVAGANASQSQPRAVQE